MPSLHCSHENVEFTDLTLKTFVFHIGRPNADLQVDRFSVGSKEGLRLG